MKLSVIIPLYNQEKYIEEALRSLHLQTEKDAEFIIIDDGSTDKSVDVAKLYSTRDSRFKYFRYENNGYGKACNLGLDLANGDYLMILEPDDFYVSNKICQEITNYMQITKCDFAKFLTISSYKNKFSSLYSFENLPNILTEKEEIYKLYSKCLPTIWANCYSIKFLKKYNIRFFETPSASYQDTFFIARVFLYANKVGLMNKVGIFYRADNNFSSSTKKNRILKMKYYIKQFNDFIREVGFSWNNFNLIFLAHFFTSIVWLTESKKLSYSEYVIMYEELHKLPKILLEFIPQFIFSKKKYYFVSIFFSKEKLSYRNFYFTTRILKLIQYYSTYFK